MFNKLESFYPNHFFPTLDFNTIKEGLKTLMVCDNKINIKDLGNTWIIEREDYIVAVNSVGSVQIHYDTLTNNEIEQIIGNIEQIFKTQANTFEIKPYLN